MTVSYNISPAGITPKIEDLSAVLLPDQKRVNISLLLNDAATRPTVEFRLLDHDQKEISQSTIIGVFDKTVNFTLHQLNHSAESHLNVFCKIILNDADVSDSRQVAVESSA